jgi:ring-1,2-phenylacetyl-CoA epoxidase subunit PaaE
MKIYTLTVLDKRFETDDTVTLCFKQPGLKKIKYLAGQYLTVIFRVNGRRYLRPYSFSSALGVDPYLEITVKRVTNGIISNHICDVVKVGDVVEVLEPMGDFILPQSQDFLHYNIVLWGAGSGITPLFSMLKSILNTTESNRHVTLVYGNRTSDSVIFKQQLNNLQALYPKQFAIYNFITQTIVTDEQPNLIQGRIKPNLVLDILCKEVNISHTLHYICGPTGLKSSVKEALTNLSIPSTQVFSEDFELVKNEADFVDIITQQVTINFNGLNQNVEVIKGKSILEAGLDASLELPYSCQTGNCSMCKGKLVSGTVKQILPKHADLSDSEFQLCCTYPISNDVTFKI